MQVHVRLLIYLMYINVFISIIGFQNSFDRCLDMHILVILGVAGKLNNFLHTDLRAPLIGDGHMEELEKFASPLSYTC